MAESKDSHDHIVVRAEILDGMADGLGPAADDVIEYLKELYPTCEDCEGDEEES